MYVLIFSYSSIYWYDLHSTISNGDIPDETLFLRYRSNVRCIINIIKDPEEEARYDFKFKLFSKIFAVSLNNLESWLPVLTTPYLFKTLVTAVSTMGHEKMGLTGVFYHQSAQVSTQWKGPFQKQSNTLSTHWFHNQKWHFAHIECWYWSEHCSNVYNWIILFLYSCYCRAIESTWCSACDILSAVRLAMSNCWQEHTEKLSYHFQVNNNPHSCALVNIINSNNFCLIWNILICFHCDCN